METKNCSKCGNIKLLSEFNKKSNSNDGFRSECSLCRKEIAKIYRENNREKIKESDKRWRKDNPDKAKETCIKSANKYRKANPEKIKESYFNWRINNPDYDKEKHKKNPHIKAWRGILNNSLLRLGTNKEGHTIDLLGYSALDLHNHMLLLFTEDMTWRNHGE